MQIVTLNGSPASCLGLAAYPDQAPQCIRRAFEAGINYFFFYGPGQKAFITGLRSLASERAEEIIVSSGSGARTRAGLRAALRKILKTLGTERIDVFFAEYINPGDDAEAIFGTGGILDELVQWKADGQIRYVGATAHDRTLAKRLAQDARVDLLMHRYNMAHRKAEVEIFPAAIKSQTPIVAFTATRWGTLLAPHPNWASDAATAVDCYRFCLAHEAVHLVLTAPKTVAELNQNLAVLKLPPMSPDVRRHWNQFGDLIYNHGRGKNHHFESQWP